MIRWCILFGSAAAMVSGQAALALARDAGGRAAGPCSPISGPDGDIPSEMPGCLRRHRPPDGSLADEMAFRRGRARTADPPPWQEPE